MSRPRRVWAPTAEDSALAAALGPHAAFLPVGGEVVAVRGAWPALDLALAVWEALPGRAHAALRQRIRTTDPPTDVDRAAVQVVAKRVVHVPGAPGPAPPWRDLAPARAAADRRIALASWALDGEPVADPAAFVARWVPAAAPLARVERDRPVAAVLLDADGRARWGGRNAGAANRVLHAELVLLLSYLAAHGRVPAGWQLVTSLQPCRMCAAVAVAAADGPLRVGYVEADPGRLAQHTALQARGWERAL